MTSILLLDMGRKKREEARIRGIRLPERLWRLVAECANKKDRTVNAQIWKIVEDWLVDKEYLKEDECKR